ncbi:MAG: secretin N-terminal domain-containing protein [Bdellovibrionales bacterium]
MIRWFCFISLILSLHSAHAEDGAHQIKFSYRNADIVKVVEEYAKESHERFMVDPSVKGKVTIINPDRITLAEAYNQLSSALALNSVAISKQGDIFVVSPSRAVQRSLIEVGSELPSLKPERMFTWIIQLKYASADEINKQIRTLSSKDGELVPYTRNNQILITDWVSNLHRVAKIVDQLDVKAK